MIQAKLTVIESGKRGREFDLTSLFKEQGDITIGRGNGSTIKFDDGRVSAHHASITYDWMELGERFYVKDHGSRNGTMIDDYEIQPMEWAVLTHGDRLSFGRDRGYVFIFEEHPQGTQ